MRPLKNNKLYKRDADGVVVRVYTSYNESVFYQYIDGDMSKEYIDLKDFNNGFTAVNLWDRLCRLLGVK